MNKLSMQTNSARNILQNAQNFTAPEKAIIEYVKNGYNYKKPKVNSEVQVQCNKEYFSIMDNGSGMSFEELQNQFLVMNSENYQRTIGNITDGEFGTGKCAAFGVGGILSIKTVKNKLLNHIEIHKKDIEATTGTNEVPVRVLIENQKDDSEDGTLVEISELSEHAKKFNINLIEKKIINTVKNKKDVNIWLQDELIEILIPEIDITKRFDTNKFANLDKYLGKNTVLTINVSQAPLDRDEQGVSIYSNTIYHQKTLAGQENKSFSLYIFGEIDLEELDSDEHEISPYLNDRNGLNKQNPMAKALIMFIGNSIEEVYKILEERDKEKKDELENKKLKKLEENIEKKINDHFQKLPHDLEDKLGGSKNLSKRLSADLKEIFKKGTQIALENSEINSNVRILSDKEIKRNKKKNDLKNMIKGENDKNAQKINENSTRSGGFRVEFKDMGEREQRGKYIPEKFLIMVNTGHKQIKKLFNENGSDDKLFQFLVQEVALNEYAYAVTSMLVQERKLTTPTDALFNLREIVSGFIEAISDNSE